MVWRVHRWWSIPPSGGSGLLAGCRQRGPDLRERICHHKRLSGLFDFDLNDGLVQAGVMTDISLGLNWYPTSSTRLMVNYIYSDVRDVGSANVVLLRYQFNP